LSTELAGITCAGSRVGSGGRSCCGLLLLSDLLPRAVVGFGCGTILAVHSYLRFEDSLFHLTICKLGLNRFRGGGSFA
jgi:hypothetical protein